MVKISTILGERNFNRNLQQTESSSISKPIQVKVTGKNEVVAMFDADNAENTLKALNSKAARKAMGIKSLELQAGDELMVDDNFNF